VVTLEETRDVGATNNRRLGVLYCSVSSGFEVTDAFGQGFMKYYVLIKMGRSTGNSLILTIFQIMLKFGIQYYIHDLYYPQNSL
jgi:hypothetical protein